MTFGTNKTARVLLIGVGYFARRLYVPYFMEHNQNFTISLVCGLDLSSQKEIISNHLQSKQYKLPVYYTSENESHTQVSDKLENLLDMIVTKHKINCVVISTY